MHRFASPTSITRTTIRYCTTTAATKAATDALASVAAAGEGRFYINTPLVPMKTIGNPKLKNCKVFLKLDNLQPSGSFKDRGISHMIRCLQQQQQEEGGELQRLICSSGGNAGHAVATVGKALGVPVDVFLPTTTKPMMIAKLKAAGAAVTIHGANWNEADALARREVQRAAATATTSTTASSTAAATATNNIRIGNNSSGGSYYIPPYDDPRIWEGHSTIVDELAAAGVKPDTIVLSVGGGGLLCGIQRGLQRHGWQHSTRIIAAETAGCASFAAAHYAGAPVKLTAATSIATSLGALSVLPQVLQSDVVTLPCVVSDAQAVLACRRFADDYNALVEPACGAALAVVYADDAPFTPVVSVTTSVVTVAAEKAVAATAEASTVASTAATVSSAAIEEVAAVEGETIVVIVCGGSVVNVELMAQWCSDFGIRSLYE